MPKYSRLVLMLALLLVGCVSHLKNEPKSWAGHSCVFTGEFDSGGPLFGPSTGPAEYNGTFRCTNPDGSHLTCPYTNQPVDRAEFGARVQVSKMTEEYFWASIGCIDPRKATPTPTATAVPTATGTATTVPVAHPALMLLKQALPNTVYSFKDNLIQYAFVITNSGDVAIEGSPFEIHDSMNPNVIACPSVKLGIGESVSCTASFTLTFASKTEAGTIKNCATAQGTYDNKPVTSNESCANVSYVPPVNNPSGGPDLPKCTGDPQPGICVSP